MCKCGRYPFWCYLYYQSGVPQGSILGPLLFVVYINNMPLSVRNSSLVLFADDAKYRRKVCTTADCELIQDDLNSLSEWSTTWKLLFKGRVVRMSTNSQSVEHTYLLNSCELTVSEDYKDLGVIVSYNLSWRAHLDYITSTAYKILEGWPSCILWLKFHRATERMK